MTIQEFLEQIQPGLTFYGVFLTVSLFSFFAGKYLWGLEKTIRDEHTSQLRDLVTDFRSTYLIPLYRNQFFDNRAQAYDLMKGALLQDVAPEHEFASKEDAFDEYKKVLNNDNLGNLKDLLLKEDHWILEDYFSSASGTTFLDHLDQLHDKRNRLVQIYRRTKGHCLRAAYFFFATSLISFLAILRPVIAPDNGWPLTVWAVLLLQALAVSLFSAILMELRRRSLVEQWEDMTFHASKF